MSPITVAGRCGISGGCSTCNVSIYWMERLAPLPNQWDVCVYRGDG